MLSDGDALRLGAYVLHESFAAVCTSPMKIRSACVVFICGKLGAAAWYGGGGGAGGGSGDDEGAASVT